MSITETSPPLRPRAPLGPNGGSSVLKERAISDPFAASDVSELAPIESLFASVLSANPGYLPGVSSGNVPFRSWYRRKDPQWVRTCELMASAPHLAGHVAVRLNGATPTGELLEAVGGPRLSWELGMLVVRPGFRGCGIGSLLALAATTAFEVPLWASVHRDGPGHRLLTQLGWAESIEISWPGDPHPGLVMVSPAKDARQ